MTDHAVPGTETFNGVLLWEVVDNGDGTGTRTTYADGQVTGTEPVTVPLVETVPDLAAEIDAARISLAAATTVAQTKARALALDALRGAQLEQMTQGA